MRLIITSLVVAGILWLSGCSEDYQPPPNNSLEIPDDTFALYLIEGYQDKIDLEAITIDSIKAFGNRIIGYQDIIGYDTTSYIFEVSNSAIANFDSLYFARYARHFPIAAISEKQLFFAVYISHGACSSIADWFKLDYLYEQPFPNNYLTFCLPPFSNDTYEPDLRMDLRMLQLFERDNKIKRILSPAPNML